MNVNLFYFFLLIGVALVIAAFFYFYPKKKNKKPSFLLFFLRFFSLISLLTLLINPKWEREEYTVFKPDLLVAVDNSKSIQFVKGTEQSQHIIEKIKENKNLNDKFNISFYSFDTEISSLDSLNFLAPQTNQMELLNQLDELHVQSNTPLFLITDGNQTNGNNYIFSQTNKKVYPFVVGDTISYSDVAITQLNVNQYSFLDNKFPVEIYTLYKGSKNTELQVSIYEKNKRIFSKKVRFSPTNKANNLTAMLPSGSVGNHYYHAVVSSLDSERNTQNNRYDFTVEVVDQQTEVLILSSFSHPDLGALKESIETNKQRKVTIEIGTGNSIDFSNYQLVILYQPTVQLASAIKKLDANKVSKFIITGPQTDWQFLKTIQTAFSKKTIQLSENYQAVYNTSFSEFVTKDIDFESLPPLTDTFGTISFQTPYQTLLYQKIGTTLTEYPLLATYRDTNQKNIVLFGEGFWRWRMMSKIANKNYKIFDEYWGTLIQYATVLKKAKQIELTYNKLVFSNEQLQVKASYVDTNYQLDTNKELWLYLADKEGINVREFPFYLKGNQYEMILSDLEAGTYSFRVEVAGSNTKSRGSFKVLDYQVEKQFISANTIDLEKLALATGGKIVYENTFDETINSVIDNPQFKSIQKSKKNSKALIDWQWLLGFIILSLSIEWFIRKFRGLI